MSRVPRVIFCPPIAHLLPAPTFPPPGTAEEAKVGPSLHTSTDGEGEPEKRAGEGPTRAQREKQQKRNASRDAAVLQKALSCVANVTHLFHVLL